MAVRKGSWPCLTAIHPAAGFAPQPWRSRAEGQLPLLKMPLEQNAGFSSGPPQETTGNPITWEALIRQVRVWGFSLGGGTKPSAGKASSTTASFHSVILGSFSVGPGVGGLCRELL